MLRLPIRSILKHDFIASAIPPPDYFGTGVSRSHLSLLNYSWFVIIKNSNPSIKKKLLPSSSEPVSCRSLINRLLLLRLNNPRPRQTRKKDGLLTNMDSNHNPPPQISASDIYLLSRSSVRHHTIANREFRTSRS
jgi:hypothetical protein